MSKTENETKQGHNKEDRIKELSAKYADCDRKSAELNDERTAIRNEIKDLGEDSKAFQDNIARLKKDRRKKQGYDESFEFIRGIVGQISQDDLFGWMDDRDAKKQAERDAKSKAREAQKAKDDTFKPAPERKPKQPKAA